MTTVKQYVDALTARQDSVCRNHLGVDVSRAGSVELRAVNLLLKIMIAGVMKALVDKGVLSDAELSAAIDSTIGEDWPPVPLDPPLRPRSEPMAGWILVPCLAQLRAELDRIAPDRDKASDGSIGDQAHADRSSSHNPDETGTVPVRDADKVNEVHAIDVDVDLRESDLTMEKVVQFLLGRCRSGAEKRLRNIIYNRRIWAASSGWVQKAYSGSNAHTQHGHFEASYETAREASTASWHLEDIPVALTEADKNWIRGELAKVPTDVWNHTEPNPQDKDADGKERPGRVGGWVRMAELRAENRHAKLLERIDAITITPPPSA